MSIVKSLSVGKGDMFYIKHNSDNFTIIDCKMSEENKETIVAELKKESAGKGITRFISTHPDEDHICNLTYLHQKMDLVNFYCVKNEATKPDDTDFDQYCALRDDPNRAFYIYKGCSRKWMNQTDEERETSGIHILWPDTKIDLHQQALQDAKDGISWNNICPIFTYSLNEGATVLWMGDLETGFMEEIKDSVQLPAVDILFAPHHGRGSGTVPSDWLAEMNPGLIVIGEAPSQHLNYYAGYNTITQNSAGDITFECVTGKVHAYVSNWTYSVDFLEEDGQDYRYGNYIGTLRTKAGNAAAAGA
jgi:beta-lactamase superfamily II metal-dependent hydrolase